MSGPVDVLAVIDDAIYALNDRKTVSERNGLIEARAAVAKLIEAAKPYASADGTKRGDDWVRLVRALARVQGGAA